MVFPNNVGCTSPSKESRERPPKQLCHPLQKISVSPAALLYDFLLPQKYLSLALCLAVGLPQGVYVSLVYRVDWNALGLGVLL